MLGGLPLFHVNALLVTGIAPMFSGARVVWPGPAGYRDPALYARFWKIVQHYRIAAMSAVPTVYRTLTEVPVDADISTLRLPIVGAAPLPSAVREAFAAHTGQRLLEGYGLTEATCATTVHPARRGTARIGRPRPARAADQGRPGWRRRVVGGLRPRRDRAAGDRRPRRVRRLRHRPGAGGPRVSRGDSVRDGWLNTGDLGCVDADGFVYLTGRAKDLIIRGGHNIDPRVIEEGLLSHPAVAAAAAVGRPDRHSGEVPVAYVVPADPARFDEAGLLAWAAPPSASPPPAPSGSTPSRRSRSRPSASTTSPRWPPTPPPAPPPMSWPRPACQERRSPPPTRTGGWSSP